MNTAFFHNIRNEIISQLNEATNEVIIAMAWFTNKDLMQSLLKCLKRGVRIKLILLDDIINHCDFGVDFNLLIKEGCEFYLYPPTDKFMHNKFCVIDGKTVITGSYNWTNYAEIRNLENIIISDEKVIIDKYTEYFNEILTTLKKIDTFYIVDADQISSETFNYRIYNLVEEIYSCTDSLDYIESYEQKMKECGIDVDKIKKMSSHLILGNLNTGLKQIVSTDIAKNKESQKLIVTEVKDFKYAVSKFNIGFKAKLISQNGKEGLKILIPRGQALPYTATVDAKSANAAEETMKATSSCELYYGETEDLNDCSKFGDTLKLTELPAKKEGEVKFKIVVSLDERGKFTVNFACVSTGTGVNGTQINTKLIEYRKS